MQKKRRRGLRARGRRQESIKAGGRRLRGKRSEGAALQLMPYLYMCGSESELASAAVAAELSRGTRDVRSIALGIGSDGRARFGDAAARPEPSTRLMSDKQPARERVEYSSARLGSTRLELYTSSTRTRVRGGLVSNKTRETCAQQSASEASQLAARSLLAEATIRTNRRTKERRSRANRSFPCEHQGIPGQLMP